MNNKTIIDNNFTVANTQKVQANGDVAVHTQVIKRPVEVKLTIGVFFDGTANNAFNTEARRNYQQKLFRDEKPERPKNVYDTSYLNENSNVYKLFQMYAFDRELNFTDKNERTAKYQQRIYIEGVGTNTGDTDNTIGLGTGFGDTGIPAKIVRAIDEIKGQLYDFFGDNKKVKIQQIQFDVFGFSRGAATARYFANIVADQLTDPKKKGDNNLLTQAVKPIIDPYRSRRWQGNLNGEVRFLGIFDTVAGLGSITNLFDAGDAETFDIDIHLRKQTAKYGLHIQAANEYRHNFSLNDVPPFFNKVILPGAHSDIGGGYSNEPIVENLNICPIHQKLSVPFYLVTDKNRQLTSDLGDELAKIRRHPDLKYLFYGVNETNFYIWQEQARAKGTTDINIYGVINIKRTVKPGLDRIALRIMYDEAVVKGCDFMLFDKDYSIPNEIIPIANKLLSAAKHYQSYQLTVAEKQLVLGQYTHSSAEYERKFVITSGELQVIDDQSQQQKTIPWQQYIVKAEYKTTLVKVHAPNLDRQGMWHRLIHAD